MKRLLNGKKSEKKGITTFSRILFCIIKTVLDQLSVQAQQNVLIINIMPWTMVDLVICLLSLIFPQLLLLWHSLRFRFCIRNSSNINGILWMSDKRKMIHFVIAKVSLDLTKGLSNLNSHRAVRFSDMLSFQGGCSLGRRSSPPLETEPNSLIELFLHSKVQALKCL